MKALQHTGAFVVQFEDGTDVEAGRVRGRIEHVASWETAHFETVDELLTFVAQMLGARSDENEHAGFDDPARYT